MRDVIIILYNTILTFYINLERKGNVEIWLLEIE